MACGAATGGEPARPGTVGGALRRLRETLESMRMISMQDGVHPAFASPRPSASGAVDPAPSTQAIVAQPDGTYMWLQSYIPALRPSG